MNIYVFRNTKKEKGKRKKNNLQFIKNSYNIFIFFSNNQVNNKQQQDKRYFEEELLGFFFFQVESTEQKIEYILLFVLV